MDEIIWEGISKFILSDSGVMLTWQVLSFLFHKCGYRSSKKLSHLTFESFIEHTSICKALQQVSPVWTLHSIQQFCWDRGLRV